MMTDSLPTAEELQRLGQDILDWSDQNPRPMPWNNLSDPYQIWIAEVILQQTRVAQGISYFKDFIEKFPDVYTLAEASEEEVMRVWEGLGYYSRARNLHAAARYVVLEYNGVMPDNYQDLLKLKGVGPYTAAAVASFAYEEPVGVVDGNVKRVIARIFGIEESIDEPSVHRHIQAVVNEAVRYFTPSEFNQAIMNFGALQCRPASPGCSGCPFGDFCVAYLEDLTAELPVRRKTLKKKEKSLHFGIYMSGGKVALQKNNSSNIWKGLYLFPPVADPAAETGKTENPLRPMEITPWILTHMKLRIHFYRLEEYPNDWKETQEITMIKSKNLDNFALPRPLRLFLKKNSRKLGI